MLIYNSSQDTDDEENTGLVDDGSSDDSEDDAPRNRTFGCGQIRDVIPICHPGCCRYILLSFDGSEIQNNHLGFHKTL